MIAWLDQGAFCIEGIGIIEHRTPNGQDKKLSALI